MITVQLLGGAYLRSGDAPLSGPPAQRHRIALLALIVASWPQPLSRDRAMAMLWPERDTVSARRLLNLAVHVLRAALGEGSIASTGDGLLWNPSRVECDLHHLREAIAAESPEHVARLYTAPLLDGFHLDDSTEFSYWLDERRNELSHAYVGALLALAARQEQSGDTHGRVRSCMRLVAADPHSAVYAQALMRALDASGDRAAALQHAGEYARRMRADLDLEPDSAVVALAEELRRAPSRRDAASSTTRSPIPSIAVLPFENLTADSNNEYFADGITDDVTAHLSRIRALKVISRTSVQSFRHHRQSLKEIAEALRVSSVLEGSVRRAGDRVRIVAKLIDVESGQHLWAETYDRDLTEVFSIQTDVALRIAAALKAELTRDEQSRLRKESTNDLHAYQLFLRGRELLIKYTPATLNQAVEFFDRAIARDPTFALAYANKAIAYIELAEGGATAPEIAYPRALAATESAMQLDSELSAAYCAMAYIKTVRNFDWNGAEGDFKRALDLSPSNPDAYDRYGRLCAGLGRFDEALALQQRAHELDPLAHRIDVVTTLIRAGRYDQAIIEGEQTVEFDPAYDRAHATLGWAHFLSGRQREGLSGLQRAVEISPDNTLWLGQLAEALGLTGNTTRAREILADLDRRATQGFVSPYHFAYVYTGLADYDRALDYLERAVEKRTGPAYSIKGSFLLTPLHDHPRFRRLLSSMNLAD